MPYYSEPDIDKVKIILSNNKLESNIKPGSLVGNLYIIINNYS